MLKPLNRIWLLPVFAVLLAGCAWGRAEFKVVQATPTPAVTATPVAETNAAPEQTPVPTPQAVSGPFDYIVRPDESLWRICRRLLGDPLAYPRAAAANHLADPNLIQPGQRLRLDPAWAAHPAGALPPASPPAPTAAPTPAAPVAAASPTPAVNFPARTGCGFKPGEKLEFSVEYFGIAAGIATLEVEQGPEVQGRPTLRLIATAQTHPAFEWIFKVRDRIESVFDARGLFSWRYEKHLREGGYSNDSAMVFDQPNHRVVKDEGRNTVPAAPWSQDVLSEFYFFRTLSVKVGDAVTIPVLADDGKAYEVVVTALRRERISGPTGTFDCIVVQPAIKFEGLFQQKGSIWIWLTDDAQRVPVLMKSQIVIGTIDVVLRNATVVE